MSAKPWEGYDKKEELKIKAFCKENGIKCLGKEYYFSLHGKDYRISPHKVELSDMDTKTPPWVKPETNSIIIIRAKKAELIEIYNSIKANVPEEKKPEEPVKKKFKLIKEEYIEQVEEKVESTPISKRLEEVEIPVAAKEEKPTTKVKLNPIKGNLSLSDRLNQAMKKKPEVIPEVKPEPIPEEPKVVQKVIPVFKPKEAVVKQDKKQEAMNLLLGKKRR